MPAKSATDKVKEAQALLTTETLLTHEKCLRLTQATPVQRAICRVADGIGLGDLWDEPMVRAAFGHEKPPPVVPEKLIVLSGTRGGKSSIAACRGVRAALLCDLEGLGPGDEIAVPVLAMALDNARAVFSHVGALASSEFLIPATVGEPKGNAILFKNLATGRPVEVSCKALSTKGSSLVSRWLASVIFDEAPRMVGLEEGQKNLDEAMSASSDRIRPGGFTGLIGSPWAPYGPVFDLVREHEGRHSEECIVVRATGPMLNPKWWTPERCEKLRLSDPVSYQTNCLAQFADPETTLIPTEVIARNIANGVPYRPGYDPDPFEYVATMDPATRGNAWTLVILRCIGVDERQQPKYEQVWADQWQGKPSDPLSPRAVMTEIADICRRYGLNEIMTDQLALDFLIDIADSIGFGVLGYNVGADERFQMCETIRQVLTENRLSMVDNRQQFSDLQRVRKKPTSNGVTVQYPVSGDGRHCDFVPALGLALMFAPNPPSKSTGNTGKDGREVPRARKSSTTYDAGALVRQVTR